MIHRALYACDARGDMFDSERLELVAGKSSSMEEIFGAVADSAGIANAFLWLSFAFVGLSLVALALVAAGSARRRATVTEA